MIDVIINEVGGLVMAHDEKALDGYDTLEINPEDGSAVLLVTGGPERRHLGALRPSLLEWVRDGMPGRSVRLSGWSLAKISPLIIATKQ